MKTVVFVDELLLVNFAAAAALLLSAGLLCGRSCTGLRLCAGSAAAAVSTLALLAPPWCAPLAVLYKIVSCCCVVAVCYGVPGARNFARLCGVVEHSFCAMSVQHSMFFCFHVVFYSKLLV